MSLVARHLEQNAIPTIVIGSALDIIQNVGVPRYLHTDFPLGNPLGAPYDRTVQRKHVEMALKLLEQANQPKTIRRSPFSWQGDPGWRDDYSRVTENNRAEVAAAGEARRAKQAAMKKNNPKQQIPMP
ncbi:MAG TPA: hypothetical protein DEF79_01110 [Gammaproteobacteria bacterium]|nr:hypothetical protein [Gammaproteobacteria bacterium]